MPPNALPHPFRTKNGRGRQTDRMVHMRLFIAINFSGEVKDALAKIQLGLGEYCAHARFTARENLHLTLAFLGETSGGRVGAIEKAMDAALFSPFTLAISGVGRFSRSGGDVLWAGLDDSPELCALHGRLCVQLAQAGFAAEARRFSPHITLAREAVLRPGFDLHGFSGGLSPIWAAAGAVDLMKSERVGGRLVYTKIASSHGPA